MYGGKDKVRRVAGGNSGTSGNGLQQGVVVVVHCDGRFLMIRRAEGILAGGSWCFVGGGIEPGESQAESVEREFAEEVGGRVRAVRKIWEYRRPDGKLLLHWWLAELDDDRLEANPAEVSDLRWCTAEEVAKLPTVLDSNVAFLNAVGRSLLGESGAV